MRVLPDRQFSMSGISGKPLVQGQPLTIAREFSTPQITAMSHPSMTGFGTSQADCAAGKVVLEIRSVNSRFFELNFRMPDEMRWVEPMFRESIQTRVLRGKVDLRLSLSRTEASLSKTQINPAGLASALRLAHEIRLDHPEIAPFSVNDLIKLPGVTMESQLSEDEWSALLMQTLGRALDQLEQSRVAEGARLTAVIEERLTQLKALADRTRPLVPAAVELQRTKLAEKLREAIASAASGSATPATSAASTAASGPEAFSTAQAAALDERIRQEAAAFGLRVDIAEELDRLAAHIDAANKAIAKRADRAKRESLGKRLDFLAQELNREANTMGSKAASAELSNISIEMKLLIEQIREQAQNLE